MGRTKGKLETTENSAAGDRAYLKETVAHKQNGARYVSLDHHSLESGSHQPEEKRPLQIFLPGQVLPDGVVFTQATDNATTARQSVERPTFRRFATYLAGFASVDQTGVLLCSVHTAECPWAVRSFHRRA
jgi:hypothetical protein